MISFKGQVLRLRMKYQMIMKKSNLSCFALMNVAVDFRVGFSNVTGRYICTILFSMVNKLCKPDRRDDFSADMKYTEISVIPLELNETPPEELSGKIDALACVLPDADVQGEDRLAADWETYRIQSVEEEHFFGTVTHKNLQLVKLNGR